MGLLFSQQSCSVPMTLTGFLGLVGGDPETLSMYLKMTQLRYDKTAIKPGLSVSKPVFFLTASQAEI